MQTINVYDVVMWVMWRSYRVLPKPLCAVLQRKFTEERAVRPMKESSEMKQTVSLL